MKKTSITQICLWIFFGINVTTVVVLSFYLKAKDTHSSWWNHKYVHPQTFVENPTVSICFFICLALSVITYLLIENKKN